MVWDRTTVEVSDSYGRLEQGSDDENKVEKKTKKTRRIPSKGANSRKKQDWFRKFSAQGGTAAGDSTAMDHIPVPLSREDEKEYAPIQSTPGNSTSRIPRLCYSIDTLKKLNTIQSNMANSGLFDQDAFYYDAQTSELRSKHGASTHVLAVGDIPDVLKFRELAKGTEYDEAFDTINKRYNGTDGLNKEEAAHPTIKTWKVTWEYTAIIFFDSEAREATGTAPATHGPYFGQGLKAGQGTPKPWIKLGCVMQSQHPAIVLVLQEEGQTDVTCYFYANSIQRDLEKDEVKFQIHGNNEAGRRHEHIREVADLRMSGDLVQVDVYP